MTKDELLALLILTKNQTLSYFDLDEDALNKTYGEEKWSVRQILHHLTDSEIIFAERLKKIIAEPRQVIWACNQDDWNNAFDYKNEPLKKNEKLAFQICRELNYELIEKYYEQYHQKGFVHSETGIRTLQQEFEKVAMHNQQHNQQIQSALDN